MSFLIYYLIPSAFLMVLFLSWIITKSVTARTGFDVAIVLFLLAMMVAMLIGPAYLYLATLNLTIGDVAIWEIAVFMSVGMMPIGVLIFAKFWIMGETERTAPLPLSSLLAHVSSLKAAYVGLVIASEFLMGWSFNLISGAVSLPPDYPLSAVGFQISYTLTNYWFVFTMAGEMALTLGAFWKVLRPNLRSLLALQAAIMFLTPTALGVRAWEMYSLYLAVAVMIGVIVYAVHYLRRTAESDHLLRVFLGLFIIANSVMMGGFLLWLVSGVTILLAATLIAESGLYFYAIFTGAGLGKLFTSAPPSARPAPLEPSPQAPSPLPSSNGPAMEGSGPGRSVDVRPARVSVDIDEREMGSATGARSDTVEGSLVRNIAKAVITPDGSLG